MVLWFIGISGSGKSTLGRILKDYLKNLEKIIYLIDGDMVREFFNNDLGYSKEERMENIKRIIYGACLLEANGVIVIVCNISPFEELRRFTRVKCKDYVEIYLKKNIKNCIKNDVKKIYHENIGKTDIVGIDIVFDEPTSSDLVLNVDELTVVESFNKIKCYLKKRFPGEFV